MDYIYSKIDNNLVDVNRIDKINLLKCVEDNKPIEGLKIGDYYLEITVLNSNKKSYCDLSDINKSENKILDKLEKDINDVTEAHNILDEKVNTEVSERKAEDIKIYNKISEEVDKISEINNNQNTKIASNKQEITDIKEKINFDNENSLSSLIFEDIN